jgi:hypothetical protein
MISTISMGLAGLALLFVGYLVFKQGRGKESDWISFITGLLIILGGLVMLALTIIVYN